MIDLFSLKQTLYCTVTVDALLKFLAHGYVFPLNDSIPIKRDFSFSRKNTIILSEEKWALVTETEKSKNRVIIEFAINLQYIPENCLHHEHNLYFINYMLSLSFVKNFWFESKEATAIFSMPLSNFIIDKKKIVIDEEIIEYKLPSLPIRYQADTNIYMRYKMIAMIYAFFKSYLEIDSEYKWYYSDYHIAILKTLYDDQIPYEKINLSAYEPFLKKAFNYFFDEISFADLFDFANNSNFSHSLKDILAFAHLLKYFALDFQFDLDGRLRIDLEQVWDNYFKVLLKEETYLTWYISDLNNMNIDTFKILIYQCLNYQGAGFTIRNNYSLYGEKAPFLALLPLIVKVIANYDLDDVNQNAKNYSDISKINTSLLVVCKVAFNGFPILNYAFKDNEIYLNYFNSLIYNNFSAVASNSFNQNAKETKHNIIYTKKGFPLIKSSYSEAENFKANFQQLISGQKPAAVEKIIKKYIIDLYSEQLYKQISSINNIQLLFVDDKDLHQSIDKFIKSKVKTILKNIKTLDKKTYALYEGEALDLKLALTRGIKK